VNEIQSNQANGTIIIEVSLLQWYRPNVVEMLYEMYLHIIQLYYINFKYSSKIIIIIIKKTKQNKKIKL